MSPKILLHIGYHKTATTWMQQLLFHPRNGYQQLASHQEIFDHIVFPHGLRFDPKPMQDLIAERLEKIEPGIVPVLSSEILSGHPFQGGHESDVYAERLKAIAPDANVLISIRNQRRMLASVYTQYLLRGGTMPYDVFFQGTREPGYFAFNPEHFEYDVLTAYYQKLFGKEAVYLLPQETLRKDMEDAVAKLGSFAGLPAPLPLAPEDRQVYAASYPEHALPVLRRLNHVQSSTINPTPILKLGETPNGLYRAVGYVLRRPPISSLFGKKTPVSDYVSKTFSGRFDAHNQRLAEIAAHPLDLTGYAGL